MTRPPRRPAPPDGGASAKAMRRLTLRRGLDRLYRLSLVAAALSLLTILVIVLVQVAFNLVDRALQLGGAVPVGLMIPSYAEIAGYLLAAASFLALAGSFRAGAHIRVNLLLRRLPAGLRHWMELGCLSLALVVALLFVWFFARLAWGSFRFGDVSPGLMAIPLWLPQAAMTLGLAVFLVALLDEWWTAWRRRLPSYRLAEAAAEAALLERAGGEL